MKPEDNPMRLFVKVGRAYLNHASKVFGKFGLHKSQPPMLIHLSHEDGISQKQLTENIGVSPASVNNMIKRMERAGFVKRRRDDEDERVSRVYLTQAGRQIIAQVEASSDQLRKVALAGFTDTEVDTLRAYLQRILGNLS
jgi:DNA-binding MarR family transcriptional regulator